MPLTGAAAARLYDDHVDAVHALITRRVGPDVSSGVVSEAFEHALRSWDRFDPDRGTERLFLFGSALTVLRNHDRAQRAYLRTLAVRDDGLPSVEVNDPLVSGHASRKPRVVAHASNEDLLGDPGTAQAAGGSPLMIAISDLPPDDRDILLLALWESCSQSAIAETLDLSVGAVRSALGRIRRELKAVVSPDKAIPQDTSNRPKGIRRRGTSDNATP